MIKVYMLGFICILSVLMSGCGLKNDLYMPDDSTSSSSVQSDLN